MKLEDWQSIFTIAGIVAAAGYFIWKILAGWLLINLELSLETVRRSKDDNSDWLAINLIVAKGSTDGLWLKDVAVRMYSFDGRPINDVIRFDEFDSLAVTNEKIDWKSKARKTRKYTIAPGETFRFGKIQVVPTVEPIIIEAAVLGTRIFWKKGFQWRSSVASLPLEKEKPGQLDGTKEIH